MPVDVDGGCSEHAGPVDGDAQRNVQGGLGSWQNQRVSAGRPVEAAHPRLAQLAAPAFLGTTSPPAETRPLTESKRFPLERVFNWLGQRASRPRPVRPFPDWVLPFPRAVQRLASCRSGGRLRARASFHRL